MSTDLPNATPRITLPISSIRVGERIRTDFGDLDELIDSFRENEAVGKPRLIHPIVIDSDNTLIDGGRRLEAHIRAGYTEIDVAYFAVLDEGIRMRLEVDANKHKRFNWKENCLAIERYHRFYAQRAALKSESWGVRETGALLGMGKSPVNYALIIAERIRANDPEILKAEKMSDALQILVDRREKEANKRLVELTTRNVPQGAAILMQPLGVHTVVPAASDADFFTGATPFKPGVGVLDDVDETPGSVGQLSQPATAQVPLSQMLHKGDCIAWMTARPASVDHIITDIPYGIDMSMLDQANNGIANIEDVAAEHDVAANRELMSTFFPAAYSVLRDKGFLITWCDQMLWQYMYDLAVAAGFRVQRWPLTWHKTSSCINQSANVNFTKNTEIALVCRKGTATLLSPQTSSVWSGGNDTETRLLGHPFVKPAGLWTWLYTAVAPKGSTVLDPFAGVGSSTIPAIQYGITPLTCEINEDHYNRQVINVQNKYLSLNPEIKFS